MNNKKTAKKLIIHCKQRLQERYGLLYSQYMRDRLLNQIRKKMYCVLLKKVSNRLIAYDILYTFEKKDVENNFGVVLGNKIKLRTLYDKQRKTFVTFLSPSMAIKNVKDNHETI